MDNDIANLKLRIEEYNYDQCLEYIEVYFEQMINKSKDQPIKNVIRDTKKLHDWFTKLPTFEIAKELSNLYELKEITDFVRIEDFNRLTKNVQSQLEDIKLRLIS